VKQQTVYVQRNIEERSCIRCYRGRVLYITYYESVFVALVIQHAKCMHHIFICGLSGFTVVFQAFHIIS